MSEIAQRILRRLREQSCPRDEVEAPEKTSEGVRENTRELSDEELQNELSNEKNKFAPIRIYSRVLGDTLWLCWDEEEMRKLIAQGVKEPVYIADEILTLRKKTLEELKKIHMIKRTFPGSIARA
jgi:ribosomal protein L29